MFNRPAPDTHSPYAPAIEAALRTAPLTAPPPLLYAAIMLQVRRSAPRPVFHLQWLDLVLSLFVPLMVVTTWLALRSMQPQWLSYLLLQAQWQWQKMLFLNSTPLLWGAIALLGLLFSLSMAAWRCNRLGVYR